MKKSLSERISESRLLLQNPYAYLDGDGEFGAVILFPKPAILNNEVIEKRRLMGNPYASLADIDDEFVVDEEPISELVQKIIGSFSLREINAQKKEQYLVSEIEEQARSLQIKMWQEREKIWADLPVPSRPLQILDPVMALKFIGYECDFQETLGQFYSNGKLVEVAATIDSSAKKVNLAHRFSKEVRKFTAAHELGHALLHKAVELHRDKAVDGMSISRVGVEFEADKFASYFLMPEKLVISIFKRIFLTDEFDLDETAALALGYSDYGWAKKKFGTRRELAKELARAERFNGAHFNSLASIFGVSIEAMAIRIEELKLVKNF